MEKEREGQKEGLLYAIDQVELVLIDLKRRIKELEKEENDN